MFWKVQPAAIKQKRGKGGRTSRARAGIRSFFLLPLLPRPRDASAVAQQALAEGMAVRCILDLLGLKKREKPTCQGGRRIFFRGKGERKRCLLLLLPPFFPVLLERSDLPFTVPHLPPLAHTHVRKAICLPPGAKNRNRLFFVWKPAGGGIKMLYRRSPILLRRWHRRDRLDCL